KENYKRFACTNSACDSSITKIPGGRQFESDEVETLLRETTLGPLQGYGSRIGRRFAAILTIAAEHKVECDDGQNDDADDAEPVDFSGAEALGPCPKCGARVFEHGLKYVCARSVGPQRSCDFSTGKIILQREISPEQVRKLLSEGRTDLLPGFGSMRARRKFKAFLVRGAGGKVGLEVEPRPAKPGAAKSGAKGGKRAGEGDAGAAPADGTTKAAAKTPGKAAARKPAAKKPAAKKAGAKKAGAKKPAAKKAGARTAGEKTTGARKAGAKAAGSETTATQPSDETSDA